MPEHFHLPISELEKGDPSAVMSSGEAEHCTAGVPRA